MTIDDIPTAELPGLLDIMLLDMTSTEDRATVGRWWTSIAARPDGASSAALRAIDLCRAHLAAPGSIVATVLAARIMAKRDLPIISDARPTANKSGRQMPPRRWASAWAAAPLVLAVICLAMMSAGTPLSDETLFVGSATFAAMSGLAIWRLVTRAARLAAGEVLN